MSAPRTAVNQAPGGGSLYPFSAASDLVAGVLDFYLSYEDDAGEVELPLTLHTGRTSEGELLLSVTDAQDNVVHGQEAPLDLAGAQSTTWGDRLVCEWVLANRVVRVVLRWEELPLDSVAEGVLDPRTSNRVPGRLRAVRLLGQELSADIVWRGGYNMTLTAVEMPAVDGGRLVSRVLVGAAPGSGMGRAPGCEEAERLVRRINGVPPASAGNFRLEADSCFRIQVPVLIGEGEEGQRVASYGSLDLSVEQARSAILLLSDCQTCCECDYFVRTYRGLQRVHNFWASTAAGAERVRDGYAANRQRWLDTAACLEDHAAQLSSATLAEGLLTINGSFCNRTLCCLEPVELWFTHIVYDENGEALDPLLTPGSWLAAATTGGPYAMGGTWPVFKATFDALDPGRSASVSYRLLVEDIQPGWRLETALTVHIPQPAGCELQSPEVPERILDTWAAAGVEPAYPARALGLRSGPLSATTPSEGGVLDKPCCYETITEVPVGSVDGINRTFDLSGTPLPNSLLIFVNGLLQYPYLDYTLEDQVVQFTVASTPSSGDQLIATYLTAE